MKRQYSRVTDSSMTDRRTDSGLLARRAVKNALSSVRGLYSKLCREVTRKADKLDRQHRIDETRGRPTARMQLNREELWNLRNENLENELKELAMKMNRTDSRRERINQQ